MERRTTICQFVSKILAKARISPRTTQWMSATLSLLSLKPIRTELWLAALVSATRGIATSISLKSSNFSPTKRTQAFTSLVAVPKAAALIAVMLMTTSLLSQGTMIDQQADSLQPSLSTVLKVQAAGQKIVASIARDKNYLTSSNRFRLKSIKKFMSCGNKTHRTVQLPTAVLSPNLKIPQSQPLLPALALKTVLIAP